MLVTSSGMPLNIHGVLIVAMANDDYSSWCGMKALMSFVGEFPIVFVKFQSIPQRSITSIF